MEDSDDSTLQMLKLLCRTCTTQLDSNSAFALLENDEPTDIGKMFNECLNLDVLSAEGYPDQICDQCQLHLKLFHTFLLKAVKSHDKFGGILQQLLGDDEQGDVYVKVEPGDEDVAFEFEVKDESAENASQNANEDSTSQDNDDDFNVEYLEQEYITRFEDELIQPALPKPVKVPTKPSVAVKAKPKNQKRRASASPIGSAQKRKYPFECAECTKGFLHREIYEAHMRSVHQGLPAFSCPHCPKTFNEKPNYDYHMQDHNNHRPAQCTLCDKSFKNKQDLNSHLRVHNDVRKYMCDVCGKRFRSQSHMVYHRYSHFEERNFHCDECPQSFKSPHILKTHKNTIHSDVFRYECNECGKKFKRDHHLVAHKRTHDTDRPKKVRRNTKKPKVEENAENIDNTIEESSQNDDAIILIISE